MHDPIGTAAVGRAGAVGGLWAVRAVRGWLALILLACALALPALPVHADATGDLFEAAESGTASEVKAALAAGADPGARNAYGATPLHLTAHFDSNPSVIEALLKAGADPGARDEAGKTSFNYAKDNEALKGTEAYWLLNDGRFE